MKKEKQGKEEQTHSFISRAKLLYTEPDTDTDTDTDIKTGAIKDK